jgi:uncharacterized membrane protein
MPDGFDETFPPADGRWHAPYLEVPMEYPPLDLPFILAPRALVSTFSGFGYVFGAVMGLCLLGAIAAAIGAAKHGGADQGEVEQKWLLAMLLLLAQGALAIQRLDAVVALFLGAAMLAAATRRPLALGLALGLAGAAKVLPLVVLPAVVAADWGAYRQRGSLLRLAAGVTTALAIGFGPLLIVPRAGIAMLRYHAARGLNVEATLGIALGVIRALSGNRQPAPASFGSQNLEGAGADLLARLALPLLVACSAWLVWYLARTPRSGAPPGARVTRIASSALAATAIAWLTSKVLSPQYLTWAIPLVLAVPGRPGRRLAWTTLAAMAVTQLYTRGFYDRVVEQAPIALLTVVTRQCLLFVLLALAVSAARKPERTA